MPDPNLKQNAKVKSASFTNVLSTGCESCSCCPVAWCVSASGALIAHVNTQVVWAYFGATRIRAR